MDRMNRMLGRMAPRPRSSREPAPPVHSISGPVLVESTIDHDVLQNMMDISTQQPDSPYRRKQRADHFGITYGGGSETDAYAPLRSSFATNQSQPRMSSLQTKRRPVPSTQYADVSPPDSPRTLEVQSPNSGEVSPIERDAHYDVHPAHRSKAKVASQIPVSKRVAANEVTLKSRAYKRDPSAPLKWDKYTGEPTTSNKGLPSGVKPIEVVQGLQQKRSVKAATAAADAEDMLMADSRPPWKGASGRTAIVQAVHTKANPVPYNATGMLTPPQSISPTGGRNDAFSRSEAMSASKYTEQHNHNINQYSSSGAMPSGDTKMANAPSGYPSPPLGKDDLDRTPPASQGNGAANDISPASTRTVRSNDRNAANQKPGMPNSHSRFSWTTLNTNTTYQHSPPPSPPPALPDNAQSIMNRVRPIKSQRNYSPNSGSPIIPDAPPFASYRSVSAKIPRPESSGSTEHPVRSSSIGHEKTYAPSMASTAFGGAKALPPTPQELASRDHISQLEAQLADLRLQRSNIERVMRDMTRPTATHALTTNFLVERERDKRVGALKDELYSIGMLEHAIGLQLHRANRRKERVEGYEGFTTLWVRRATGLSCDP